MNHKPNNQETAAHNKLINYRVIATHPPVLETSCAGMQIWGRKTELTEPRGVSLPTIKEISHTQHPRGNYSKLLSPLASWKRAARKLPSSIRQELLGIRRIIVITRARMFSLYRTRSLDPWMPIISQSQLCDADPSAVTPLLPAEEITPLQPHVFPSEAAKHFECGDTTHFTFPKVFALTLQDATVYGGTNLVRHQAKMVRHDLMNLSQDATSEELHGRMSVSTKRQAIRWLQNDLNPEKLDEAASFVDACALNYAHWITEVLPRIAVFCEYPEFANIPIIINNGLSNSQIESLALIVGPSREVIALSEKRAVQVRKLHVVSPTGYLPFGQRKTHSPLYTHGIFSSQSVGIMRQKILAALSSPSQDMPSKVYLPRPINRRGIVNSAEVERCLVENGYIAVYPERLSFMDQVLLFAQAESIIGATGAAFANLVFTNPSTKICVMTGCHPHAPYGYWQNIATTIGNRIRYLIGSDIPAVHSNFSVDIALLKAAL